MAKRRQLTQDKHLNTFLNAVADEHGLTFSKTGSGHLRVLSPSNETLAVVGVTPGRGCSTQNSIAQIKRALRKS